MSVLGAGKITGLKTVTVWVNYGLSLEITFTLCVARLGLYAVKVNCFRVTMALLLVFFLFLAFIQERLQEVCS